MKWGSFIVYTQFYMAILFYANKYAAKLLRYEQKHNFKGSAVSGIADKIT